MLDHVLERMQERLHRHGQAGRPMLAEGHVTRA